MEAKSILLSTRSVSNKCRPYLWRKHAAASTAASKCHVTRQSQHRQITHILCKNSIINFSHTTRCKSKRNVISYEVMTQNVRTPFNSDGVNMILSSWLDASGSIIASTGKTYLATRTDVSLVPSATITQKATIKSICWLTGTLKWCQIIKHLLFRDNTPFIMMDGLGVSLWPTDALQGTMVSFRSISDIMTIILMSLSNHTVKNSWDKGVSTVWWFLLSYRKKKGGRELGFYALLWIFVQNNMGDTRNGFQTLYPYG